MPTYKIVRMYLNNHPSRVLRTGLTLEDVLSHCKDPETSSSTAKKAPCLLHTKVFGDWFDGFEKE